MHVDTSSITTKSGKTYTRHLLRTSYREERKVKHKTIANLSSCTEDEIAAIKLALKHKGNLQELTSFKSLNVEQGLAVGAVWTLKTIAERLGIGRALGKMHMGVLALWLVCARLIDQGSRLSAVRLAGTHAACDVLGIDKRFTEDTLYKVLDWCCENQQEIEDKLFRSRYRDTPPRVYLYDVTSSYLEGQQNELGEYGYNRDGKKGKKQIVIGLLTDPKGFPLSVQAFKGNTPDQSTVWDQIRKLKDRFGAERVTLVGDRGMLKSPQQESLNDEDFHFITAITKPQIEKLLKSGIFQLELFETQICEVEVENIRYILRRNPQRRNEIRQNRDDMIRKVHQLVNDRNRYLSEHPKANPDVAFRKVTTYISKRKLSTFCMTTLGQRRISIRIDEEAKKEYEKLDGCYAIKTDLKKEHAGAKEIHDRYKDLAQVEQAFGMMKTVYLEERPFFVRKACRTRGHMLIVMLAYMITHHIRGYWNEIDCTVEEGIRELSSISADVVRVAGKEIAMIPTPRSTGAELLKALDVVLPKSILHLGVKVATKKKLPDRRQLSK